MSSNERSIELNFDDKYGKLIDYKLFGDRFLVCSFSEGL
jgi:hypothetical protein